MHAVYEDEAVNQLRQHVGKVVRVTLSNKREVKGTVFTIDPVSRSIAIIESESLCLEILMGPAVVSIEGCPEEDAADLSRLLPSTEPASSPSEQRSLEAVKSWLLKNRISVEEGEGGELTLLGAVSLRPPYHPDGCTGDNELVVERVRDMLRKMPRE